MASVSDRVYFPPLEDSLFGERVLLSWKHVATALSDVSGQRQKSPNLIDFFDDDYVHHLLKNPSSVFAPPSDATKKDYETKTAPINVTSAGHDRVDIHLVKEDAAWLSKNVKINLVAALRIVIIELQSRPAHYLLGPLSSHDATNLTEAAGLGHGQGASFLADFGASAASDAEKILTDFESNDARRRRLVDTYFTERRSFMMVADYIYSIKIYDQLPIFTGVDRKLSTLYRLQLSGTVKDEVENSMPAYLEVLSDSMASLEPGLQSLTDDKLILSEDVEMDWVYTIMTEAVHALSVILHLADGSSDDHAPSASVNQWFALMGMYSFFDNFQPPDSRLAELAMPLTSLAAAVSLALLRPSLSLRYLEQRESDPTLVGDAHDSYLLSSDVLEQVHNSVMAAANANIVGAYPVIFAWCHILHQMTTSYTERSEKRDNLLMQSARARFEGGQSEAPVARPAALGRRNSAGSIYSIESSRFDVFLENSSLSRDMSVVGQLAHMVSGQGQVQGVISTMASDNSLAPLTASSIRTLFLELLEVSYHSVGYATEPVNALMSLLASDQSYWDIVDGHSFPAAQDIRSVMLYNPNLLQQFLRPALAGYPYELLPFLTLCRALCSAPPYGDDEDHTTLIMGALQSTPSLTLELPPSFMQYELIDEEENLSFLRILEDLPLVSLSSSWRRRQAEDDTCSIPAGTSGVFVSGRTVKLEHTHSTLALLGRRLEIHVSPERYQCVLGLLQPDEVAEIIALFATLIRVDYDKTRNANNSLAVAHREGGVIQDASQHISGGKDLITIVCDVMDSYLQDEYAATDNVAVEVLNSCILFLHAILPEHPSRVWSYLARCDLLNSESKAGKLTRLVGTLDLATSRFEFLNSSVRLFSDMMEGMTAAAVQHRMGSPAGAKAREELIVSKAKEKSKEAQNGFKHRDELNAAKSREEQNPWAGMSGKVLSKLTHSIAVALVDVFENTSTWRFQTENQRATLLSHLVPILTNLLKYSFSIADPDRSDNLTSSLRPAAVHVLDCFLEPATGTLRFQSVLSSLIKSLMTPIDTLHPRHHETTQRHIVSILSFLTTLLRVSDLLDKPSNMLETYLFKISTLLARICAVSAEYLAPATELLDVLVFNAGKSSNEPLSLLGYLGSQTSKMFLELLSALGKPYILSTEVRGIWKLFSAILRNRQQWMSNCLLTGKSPREVIKNDQSKKSELSSHSIFSVALRKLSKLKELDTDQALAILDFVSSAQNYWPWTIFSVQKDTTYLQGLQTYVRDLKPSRLTAKVNSNNPAAAKVATTDAAVEARIAAYIGETFAMQLYHARHRGTADALAKELAANLDYFLRDGVEVDGYNSSLHKNLAKNFKDRYLGCSLDDFQRTILEPRQLGTSFYYDLDLANRMLSFDSGWLGQRDDGYKMEMELANANLSLVDAQIALFHAWEFLLLELSTCLGSNEVITKHMLQVAQNCLKANQAVPGPESIFVKVIRARANLALMLIQRLVQVNLKASLVYDLLSIVVATILGVEEPYTSESIGYHRTLLKTLYITLRAYQNSKTPNTKDGDNETVSETSVQMVQLVFDILDRVVGQGFRSLVSLIHDNESAILPEDLALLTAILQACLSLPTIERSQVQILNIMASHNCMYAATSLFSWADKLSIQGDPVYGELSVLFLLELSVLPLLAEQMACDGILSNLLSANLTKYMLKTNVSPDADAPLSQRCYGIWTKGLLPIMLNFLTALGGTVAVEVAYVLNQFSHLLRSSVDRFEAPGASRTQTRTAPHYITLVASSEINSLALLTRILSGLRQNTHPDIPNVEWDAPAVLENIEFWLSSERLLKERLLPLGPREQEWRTMKPDGMEDSLLETKVKSQLEAVREVLSEEVDDD